jgi:SAM-dependent methyltransferase
MTDYRELLLGCGYDKRKKINPYRMIEPRPAHARVHDDWRDLVTLDVNVSCAPDIVLNLDTHPDIWQYIRKIGNPKALYWEPLPLAPAEAFRVASNYFDEVHAYEVLEHLGQQGDYAKFFENFSGIWRVLKPGGMLVATVPSRFSPWFWGDPGHRRAILPETLDFLNQPFYEAVVGKSPSSDYRDIYRADFDVTYRFDNRAHHTFILTAVKPSRLLQP